MFRPSALRGLIGPLEKDYPWEIFRYAHQTGSATEIRGVLVLLPKKQ
jgi:hypothetical protein